jgi:hypothetical protein
VTGVADPPFWDITGPDMIAHLARHAGKAFGQSRAAGALSKGMLGWGEAFSPWHCETWEQSDSWPQVWSKRIQRK